MSPIRKPFQMMLVGCAVLLVYFPAIFGEVSLLDDRDMTTWLISIEQLDLKGLFLPRSSDAGYYRPLILLTYLVDRFAWGTMPVIMHFENVFLHLVNALLVLGIADQLFNRTNRHPFFPLVAALLFGLHPIATESVCWISGRTDILAGNFVLAATWLIVRYITTGRLLFLLPAFLLVFLGSLAKETALSFIPAALLILWGGRRNLEDDLSILLPDRRGLLIFFSVTAITLLVSVVLYNFWIPIIVSLCILCYLGYKSRGQSIFQENLSILGMLLASGLVAGGGFWFIRHVAFTSNTSRISQTFTLILGDMNYAIQLFLGANAFYLRKFLFPLPLNAAIREIDPLYTLAGTVLLICCVILMTKPSLFSGLFLAGFCMTIPVLPFAFGTIAWTAYAERYIYLSMPFWLLAVGCLIPCTAPSRSTVAIWGTVILLFLASGAIFQRSMIWGNNIAMASDMVEKSPRFKMARGLYMTALIEAGRYQEAEAQYWIASELPSVFYEEKYDLLMAMVYQLQGRDTAAEQLLLNALEKSKGQKPSLLKALANFYEERALAFPSREREKFERLALWYTRQLHNLDKDPHTLYKIAKLHLRLGESADARTVLKQTLLKLPVDDPSRKGAEKLLDRLED